MEGLEMNDFTKDELTEIYEALMDALVPISEYLPSKVQSMIDDYGKYKFTTPDDMDSSAIAWKYQHGE